VCGGEGSAWEHNHICIHFRPELETAAFLICYARVVRRFQLLLIGFHARLQSGASIIQALFNAFEKCSEINWFPRVIEI